MTAGRALQEPPMLQVTDDLIRSVVQEVLGHMKPNGAAPKAKPSGNAGVFDDVDEAVRAAAAAQRKFEALGLDARRKAVDCVRKICLQRAEELAKIGKQVDQRIQLKNTITLNLIEGRTTLAGAASDFQALNLIEPEIASATHMIFRGRSMEESTALQVVSYVRACLKKDDERLVFSGPKTREFLEHLDKEFEVLCGHKPGAYLPQ